MSDMKARTAEVEHRGRQYMVMRGSMSVRAFLRKQDQFGNPFWHEVGLCDSQLTVALIDAVLEARGQEVPK